VSQYKANEYRQWAAQCLSMAQRAQREEDKCEEVIVREREYIIRRRPVLSDPVLYARPVPVAPIPYVRPGALLPTGVQVEPYDEGPGYDRGPYFGTQRLWGR
jgi:hypothetical protein